MRQAKTAGAPLCQAVKGIFTNPFVNAERAKFALPICLPLAQLDRTRLGHNRIGCHI
jgi:hypothetical protein